MFGEPGSLKTAWRVQETLSVGVGRPVREACHAGVKGAGGRGQGRVRGPGKGTVRARAVSGLGLDQGQGLGLAREGSAGSGSQIALVRGKGGQFGPATVIGHTGAPLIQSVVRHTSSHTFHTFHTHLPCAGALLHAVLAAGGGGARRPRAILRPSTALALGVAGQYGARRRPYRQGHRTARPHAAGAPHAQQRGGWQRRCRRQPAAPRLRHPGARVEGQAGLLDRVVGQGGQAGGQAGRNSGRVGDG